MLYRPTLKNTKNYSWYNPRVIKKSV